MAQQSGPATLENLLNSPAPQPLTPSTDSPAKARASVPDQAAVKEAQDLIRQAYENDHKTAVKNPEPLIQKLLAAAGQTKEPVRKYAFLISAEEAAVAGGDCRRTIELIDARAGEFAIDGLQSRIERLAEFLTPKAKTDPELLVRLYQHAIETAERGVKQNSFEQAKAAAEMAASIAQSLFLAGKAKKNDALVQDGEIKQAQATSLVTDIERRAGVFVGYKAASETLKTKPDDPAANGAVGRYLCFELSDWIKGLPLLAKGDSREMAEVAAQELKMLENGKPEAKQLFEVAGKWWAIGGSGKEDNHSLQAIRKHSANMYSLLQSQLSDPLDQALAKQRASASEVDPNMDAIKAVARPAEPGTGLLGQYFTGTDLDARRRVFVRVDPELNMNFKAHPVGQGVPDSNFSIRWTGFIAPEQPDSYTFIGHSDDGIRIAINGKVILNEWGRWGGFQSAAVPMRAGKKYRVVIEYCARGGKGDSIVLDWKGEKFARERVPTRCLYPPDERD